MTDAIVRFLQLYQQRLIVAFATHFLYVLISVSIAFVVAVLLAILLSRIRGLASVLIPLLSVFQTIPGIVFVGILFLYNGMTASTVVIALTIYAVFPILKNSYVGIIKVDDQYKEAARGCGMSPMQILWKVELALALPSIISGFRISVVYTVSWAVIAAMIGMGGLGEIIYSGIMSNNNVMILGGAIPAAIMAILLSRLIDVARSRLLPRSMRRGIT
jgi:osmoprotectant transport system permease protein